MQMKKAAIIILAQDKEPAVKNLRKLGVLHIEPTQPATSKDITLLKEELSLIKQVMAIMTQDEFCPAGAKFESKEPQDSKRLVSHIIDCHKRIEQLKNYSHNLITQIALWKYWGDFAPEEITSLRGKGIYIKLYYIPKKDLKDLPQDLCVSIIFTKSGIAHCAITSRRDFILPFKELTLPRMSLGLMRRRLADEQKILAALKEDIRQSNCYYQGIARIKKTVEKDIEYQQALKGMGEAAGLSYLTGYVPFDKVELLLNLAKNEKWAISVDEPSDEDNVPTLIRNPRWVSIINPVFKMIEVIPGYRELDTSLWFLIFFSVFFGMLIGDAGYGLAYVVITFFAQKKWGRRLSDRSVFILFYLLSFCAIIWGFLSATFFGQEWLPQYIRPLLPALRSDKNMQSLCFFLGALHLSVAHLWRAILKFPTLTFLADAGWISVLWGAFFLARLLILGDNFPQFAKWFFIIGPVLVVLFFSPHKNILKGIGNGLGNLVLNIANSFTDVVSYIRLFAVGLATVAVADAFNKMAMGVGFNNFLQGLLTSFILLIGHLLNVILGPLSILVHGVRLNVLEFCSHLDVKWSGFAYKPLQESSV